MKKTIVITAFIFCATIKLSAQQSDCSQIWGSIERYQTYGASNLLSTNRNCLTDSLKTKLISILKGEFSEEEINIRVLKSRPDD